MAGRIQKQLVGKELEEGDVVTNETAREKSSLLRAEDGGDGGPEAGGEEFGKQAVIRVEEGDGAIIGRVGRTT